VIDTHVNLHHEAFADDFAAVMARAVASGIDTMVTISDMRANQSAIAAIADAHSHVFRTVGAHPHYAKDHLDWSAADLIAAASASKVVGIGETGLDFHYMHSPIEDQVQVFAAHTKAAQATGLPLVVHTRNADEMTATMLEAAMAQREFPLLLHCYTSGLDLLRRGLALGGFVSFSGIATFKNATEVRAAAALVPGNRILIETDCPYLAPVPMRGRRNEPSFLPHVAAFLAHERGMEPLAFAQQADDNARALFGPMAHSGVSPCTRQP
jgi:TatD DNase family protein